MTRRQREREELKRKKKMVAALKTAGGVLLAGALGILLGLAIIYAMCAEPVTSYGAEPLPVNDWEEVERDKAAWEKAERDAMGIGVIQAPEPETLPPASLPEVVDLDIEAPDPEPAEPEIDPEELRILAHLICGEAQCYTWEHQIAVGSVVLNRVKSSHYPDTLKKVVFQKGQYACTWDGNYDREPTATNWKAAEFLLRNGSQIPDGVLYQAQFRQGSGVWKKIGSSYFCWY